MELEPKLTAATVIHHVVGDLLSQREYAFASFPEIVDLAVINTGLGTLQSSFSFVKQASTYWDSTYWDAAPRPFLDTQALAYASAIAAWMRGDNNPDWATGLPAEVIRPMKKSLKYLFKTDDSFFHRSTASQNLLSQTQREWLATAANKSSSKQVIAIRHLKPDQEIVDKQESLLLEKLRSPIPAVVLHSISAVESLNLKSESIANELRMLAENPDDETRAKAIMALARLQQLDELTIGLAAKMIDSSVKYVVYAGVFTLSSLDSVSEHELKIAERGFLRALQSCDYEFVGLFASAFNLWLEDPESHFEQLLQDDQPGYLEIAIDALQNVKEQPAA